MFLVRPKHELTLLKPSTHLLLIDQKLVDFNSVFSFFKCSAQSNCNLQIKNNSFSDVLFLAEKATHPYPFAQICFPNFPRL